MFDENSGIDDLVLRTGGRRAPFAETTSLTSGC